MKHKLTSLVLGISLLLGSVGVSCANNLSTCLSGLYPSLCKRHLLTPDQARQADAAERQENWKTCRSGRYPSLCKRHLLTPDQARQADGAGRQENWKTCRSGRYPSLCKRHLLTPDQARQADAAERQENWKTCRSGRYPSLCKRHLLTPDQARQADAAERGESLPPGNTREFLPPSNSVAEKEIERLRRENARLKKQNQKRPKQIAKRAPQPTPKSATSGSGFFVSKTGHVITNQHVVGDCKIVTVGDNAKKQVTADILETDRRNDLALLKISSLKMASVETRSLIQKLGIKIVPLASDGLLRSEDVDLGEDVLVAGYPYGEIFSDSIKVTKGIVSANKGLGDDSGQFQVDAAVQPGNSGGPIYDENGNIVGVVVAQLNKVKFAKLSGSIPENVNFGIKASTVRQFLSSSGLPTKWSRRSKPMSTRELAKIAKRQTVMVMCHR
jgi:S1-C subfamily serine protease